MRSWPSGRPKGWSASGLGIEAPAHNPSMDSNKSFSTNRDDRAQPPILPACLADRERGAVILPSGKISGVGNELIAEGVDFDEDAVRGALLFFERLDYPSNSMIQVGPSSPAGLESWEGLQRTRIPVSGAFDISIYKGMFLKAYLALEAREPGRWVISRGSQSIGFPDGALQPQAAFIMKLVNALPLPDRSVPYDDVLSFKQRRQPELRALRHHLEGLALEVGASGWGGLAETVVWERFQKSLDDHISTMREVNFAKRLMNLEVKFNWTELFTNKAVYASLAATAAQVNAGIPLHLASWTALTALAPCISFGSTYGLRGKMAPSPQPFEYIFRAGREL